MPDAATSKNIALWLVENTRFQFSWVHFGNMRIGARCWSVEVPTSGDDFPATFFDRPLKDGFQAVRDSSLYQWLRNDLRRCNNYVPRIWNSLQQSWAFAHTVP